MRGSKAKRIPFRKDNHDRKFFVMHTGTRLVRDGHKPDGKPKFKVIEVHTLALTPECGRGRYRAAQRAIRRAA